MNARLLVDYAAGGIGLLANLFLVYLVVRRTSKEFASYSKILLLNCTTDIVFTMVVLTTNLRMITQQGHTFFVLDGLLRDVRRPFNCWIVALNVEVPFLTFNIIPLQFLYRYSLVCRGKQPSKLACLTSVFCSLVVAFIFGLGDVWAYGGHVTQAESRIVSNLIGRHVASDTVATRKSNPLATAITFGRFVVNFLICYAIILWTAIRIRRTLISNEKSHTSKTAKMHHQLTKVYIVQTATPFISMTAPITVIMLDNILSNYVQVPPTAITIIFAIIAFVPVFNPISTIYLIPQYRRFVARTFSCLTRSASVGPITSSAWSR